MPGSRQIFGKFSMPGSVQAKIRPNVYVCGKFPILEDLGIRPQNDLSLVLVGPATYAAFTLSRTRCC